jgi:hypothetical protein
MPGAETEAKSCFIDTNIWLYAFTIGDDLEKTICVKRRIETQSVVCEYPGHQRSLCESHQESRVL